MRARIDHANSIFVDIVANERHTALGVKVCQGAVHEKRGVQVAVLLGILLYGLRHSPDAVKIAQQAILVLWRQAMPVNTLAVGSERKLLGRVNDANALEPRAKRVVGSNLHGQGIIEHDMRGLESGDMLAEQVNQSSHVRTHAINLAFFIVRAMLQTTLVSTLKHRTPEKVRESAYFQVFRDAAEELLGRPDDAKDAAVQDDVEDIIIVDKEGDVKIMELVELIRDEDALL